METTSTLVVVASFQTPLIELSFSTDAAPASKSNHDIRDTLLHHRTFNSLAPANFEVAETDVLPQYISILQATIGTTIYVGVAM